MTNNRRDRQFALGLLAFIVAALALGALMVMLAVSRADVERPQTCRNEFGHRVECPQ